MYQINTQVIKILNENDYHKLDAPAFYLRRGEIVAFPTETVYGLGVNAYLESAAGLIYKVKGRPSDNPLIVHISDIKTVYEIAKDIPEVFFKLADKFWPGPLTVILKKKENIPDSVSAGLETIGIRMPDNKVALKLIEKAGCPVAAPSANISGTVSATDAKYVYEDFKDKIPYIIDGGSTKVGVESTVLSLVEENPVILRPGGITLEAIREIVPDAVLHKSIGLNKDIKNPSSPGMKYKHYSPKCPVFLICGSLVDCERYILNSIKDNECAFAFEEQMSLIKKENSYNLGSINNPAHMASKIFSYLRDADNAGYEKIYITGIEEKGLGLAIMNRLKKSAGENVINIKNIVFVCTGNTCRSPMAEFILKSYNIDGLNIYSRGLNAAVYSEISENSRKVLLENNIDAKGFRSAQLTKEDLENAYRVYTMTKGHKEAILKRFPEYDGKVFTLKEDGDISDPFMQDIEVYRETFNEISKEIKRIADEFKD